VNGDGKPDLVVANLCDINCSGVNGGVVGVLLGNGDGTFQTAVPYSTGQGSLSSVAVADVNGDGKPDFVVANEGVGVLLGKGDGTFQQVVTYNSGGTFPTSAAIADVNGDGKPDLIVANCDASGSSSCVDESVDGVVGVLLGNGDETFQTVVAYDSGGSGALSVAVADVNGDGTTDLLVANFCDSGCFFGGSVGVLLGQGHGIFASPVSLVIPGVGNSIAVADLNSDGKPDLLVATGPAPGTGTVAVLLNNMTFGKFPTSTGFMSSLNPSIYGQKVTWTATVTSSGSITPTGRVNFTSNIVTIGSATLNSNGVATLTRSNLNANLYPVTAVYNGDTNNLGSTSVFVNQVVKQTTTKATLTSLPNPSTQGEAVTLTARISSPTVVPTGPVTFMAGKTVLGTAQLSGGKATLVISTLPVGSTRVTATYNGNSNIAKSSASVTQTVR
jgi:Bacterial Ig-like domain (group 3)/FG-GAP-like repeat/FG-GAP repeat